LRPCAHWIVAGHKNKDLDDDATRTIAETRDYLDAVDELLPKYTKVLVLFIAMLERFPVSTKTSSAQCVSSTRAAAYARRYYPALRAKSMAY
jgi:hypothetical protein